VKAFFDASVLVAAFVPAHPRHEAAFDRARRALSGEFRLVTCTHTVAEVYSVLTTLPLSPRITPGAAARILRENLVQRAELQPLSAEDYLDVVGRVAELGLAGGVVCDALAGRAAQLAGAEVIYTFNPRDFRRVLPDAAIRIEEPAGGQPS
jgi:predicted nucleic acid-binding protein